MGLNPFLLYLKVSFRTSSFLCMLAEYQIIRIWFPWCCFSINVMLDVDWEDRIIKAGKALEDQTQDGLGGPEAARQVGFLFLYLSCTDEWNFYFLIPSLP